MYRTQTKKMHRKQKRKYKHRKSLEECQLKNIYLLDMSEMGVVLYIYFECTKYACSCIDAKDILKFLLPFEF